MPALRRCGSCCARRIAEAQGARVPCFTSQNLGAGQPRRALRSGWIAAVYNGVAMVLLSVAMIVWGGPIVAFFDDDPTVVAFAVHYLRMVSPAYLALGAGIVLGSSIQGAGQTRLTLIVDLLVVALFQLPASIAAVSLGSPTPGRLWSVVAASSVMLAIAYVVAFRR